MTLFTNANVHRGVYELSQEATDLFEGARARIAPRPSATPRSFATVTGASSAVTRGAAERPRAARRAIKIRSPVSHNDIA